MMKTRVRGRAIAVMVFATALVTAACSSPDRAGGDAGSDTVVLTLAQPNGDRPRQIQAWADEVSKASGGSLEIKFEDAWRLGQPDYEFLTIGDVRSGKADMAWVGARAFDRAGVTSFQALHAPMLIDSLDLQQKVFDAGIPEQMMAGLDALDLVGVGALPGPLRKVLGVDKAFDKPADFVGTTMGIQDSGVAAMTFEAVGATTKKLPVRADLTGVDGYEAHLGMIWGNHYDEVAKTVTGNLNLWPRPLVLFIGKPAYDNLNEAQKAALTGAADAVSAAATTISRGEDSTAFANICAAGMTVTKADLPAFTKVWAPVYDTLRANPATKDWIDRISELKASTAVPADTASCADVTTSSTIAESAAGGGLEDGTYETVLTPADFAAVCKPGDPGAENVATIRDSSHTVQQFDVKGDHIVQYQLAADGKRERGWSGTYAMFRDTFELVEDGIQHRDNFNFTVDNGVLTLTNLQSEYCDGKLVWTSQPWTKVPSP